MCSLNQLLLTELCLKRKRPYTFPVIPAPTSHSIQQTKSSFIWLLDLLVATITQDGRGKWRWWRRCLWHHD